uniref:tRNA (32-2'-O)-methyltransferase regulator THADA n=1 Tax=Setaria digitata TaxID=48799 RepID=A0A915PJZ5_9BILA
MTIDCEKPKCYDLSTTSVSCFSFLFRKPTKDWFGKCCAGHDCFLLDACIPAILHLSQREEELVLRECDEDRLFDFVCKFWDYVSEAVCYDCINIFESLMRLHLAKCPSNGPLSSWARNIGKFLANSPSSCRGRYRCILVYNKIMVSFSEDLTDKLLCEELYSLLSNPTLVAVVSELIAFDIIRNYGKSDRLLLHSNLLRASLHSPMKAIRTAVRDRLLPEFSKNSLLLDWVVENLKTFQSGDVNSTVSLEVPLYIAKFCLFHQKGNGNVLEWTSFIDESVVISALLNATAQIRVMAWNLICDHPKLAAPISNRQLELCKCFLATNMAEQSPAIRLSILSGLKKILIRIRENGRNILRNGTDEFTLEPYVNFICSLRDLCFENLVEYANFSRRIMALQMLEYLFLENYLVSDDNDLFFKFSTSKLRPTETQILRILRCLDDSYELCQISALRLLSSSFFEIHNFDFASYLVEMKKQMFSIRSLFTLTSGYRLRFYLKKNPDNLKEVFYYLLNMCKDRVKLISEDLLMIATNHGFVYSLLSAVCVVLELLDLRSVLTNSDSYAASINQDLLPMCFEISELVAPVVNSMSPEGFVPNDHIKVFADVKNFEKSKENTDFHQALLASCWRSHKYVSAIFYIIIKKWLGSPVLSSEAALLICNYYWRQLTECKHCGAIETAIEGFEALCAKLWSFALADCPEFKDLPCPDAWVKQILDLIDDEKNVLCATRRSAGLPHLIIAVLVKEPITNDAQCLKRTMIAVLETERKSYETQVHGLNIIRAVFLNSRLSELVLCYVEPAINFCFASFGSNSWAVRSAASQLFVALITRMFGIPRSTQLSLHPHEKNRMSSFEFFTRFPSLYDSLHRQFHENEKSVSHLRMFAVLILLTHLFPSPRHREIYSLSTYVLPLFKFLLSCRAMRLRELSAAALTSICEIQDADFLLKWVSRVGLTAYTQNEICSIIFMLMEFTDTFNECELRNSIQSLVGRVESDKQFQRWCDYNRFLFLKLLLKMRYRFTVSSIEEFILSDAVLVFRPLAKWICNEISCNIKNLLMRSKPLRFEFWRALSKSTIAKLDDTKLIQLAVCDFRNSGSFVQRHILTLFLNSTAPNLSQLFDIFSVKHFLHELSEMSRQSNRHLINLLLIKLDQKDWRFKWLYNSAIDEDQKVQYIAVRALELLLKKGHPDVQLCKVIVLLLKNENEVIREKVAELCSHVVNRKIASLNPEILFWWFVKRYPNIEEIVIQYSKFGSNERTHLFDACVSNPYIEATSICSEYLSNVLQLIS